MRCSRAQPGPLRVLPLALGTHGARRDGDAADGALPSASTRLVACRAAAGWLLHPSAAFTSLCCILHPCAAALHPCAASPHPRAASLHPCAASACTCCISASVRCISASQALQPCCPCPCFALAAASVAGMRPGSRADASAVPCGGALSPSQPEAHCSCHAAGMRGERGAFPHH